MGRVGAPGLFKACLSMTAGDADYDVQDSCEMAKRTSGAHPADAQTTELVQTGAGTFRTRSAPATHLRRRAP